MISILDLRDAIADAINEAELPEAVAATSSVIPYEFRDKAADDEVHVDVIPGGRSDDVQTDGGRQANMRCRIVVHQNLGGELARQRMQFRMEELVRLCESISALFAGNVIEFGATRMINISNKMDKLPFLDKAEAGEFGTIIELEYSTE